MRYYVIKAKSGQYLDNTNMLNDIALARIHATERDASNALKAAFQQAYLYDAEIIPAVIRCFYCHNVMDEIKAANPLLGHCVCFGCQQVKGYTT